MNESYSDKIKKIAINLVDTLAAAGIDGDGAKSVVTSMQIELERRTREVRKAKSILELHVEGDKRKHHESEDNKDNPAKQNSGMGNDIT